MTRFRIPLALNLLIWAFIFSLAPLFIVFAFMQLRMRETYISTRLETHENQARLYSDRLNAKPDDQQETTVALSKALPGNTFFLLGTDGKYVAHSDPTMVGKAAIDDLGSNITGDLFASITTTYSNQENDILLASFRNGFSDPVAASMSGIDSRAAPFSGLTGTLLLQVTLAMLGMALALGIVLNTLLAPATQLSEFANQIGKKNFVAKLAPSRFGGELAQIANSMMMLSENIQTMIAELEQSVIDRTRELEYRAVQLKATADVGKAITSVRNLSELLQQTTVLINERFGYYHVGIFLLDERREYAVLSASNSEGGQRMLGKNHKLKIGETGIVGHVTESAQARIALDVGQDAVFFDNPDLPNTRSEMALPLVASGQILGALDVQSTEPQAFSQEDITTLQMLADQIAVAIQNANLNSETEKALETARHISGEVSRDAWKRIKSYQSRIGFIATTPGAVQTQSEKLEPSMATAFESGDLVHVNDGLTISLPIKIRGEVIGAIRLKKSEISEAWTQDETNLALSLADQLSGALESARLYRESQQRAARESLVSDISARISASSRVESVIRETVQELGQAIGNAKITFQLQNEYGGQEQPGGPEAGTVTSSNPGRSKE